MTVYAVKKQRLGFQHLQNIVYMKTNVAFLLLYVIIYIFKIHAFI